MDELASLLRKLRVNDRYTAAQSKARARPPGFAEKEDHSHFLTLS
jgi:hypothetical protein